ncbi:MAG: ATP-dependent zinc metalloprotease FtsH [Rikenellaceae bacterium]|nr:ATP-dependent zinc metalloprotease FtsH [Rikenellaceae bacterium]
MATPNNKQRKPQRVIRFNIINIVWFVVAAVIIGWWMMDETGAPSKTTWNEVEQMVKGNKVEKIVVVNRDMARVYLTPEAIEEYRATDKYANIPEAEWQFQFNIGSVDSFREDLGKAQNEESNIIVDYVNEGGGWGETLISFLPWLIFIGIWIFMMRSMSGGGGGAGGQGIFNVGKAKAQVFDKGSQNRVTFKDVAGLEEAKVEIMEIVDFLRKPDKYRNLGGKIPKGALLVGPPGTGKTLLAKAVAGEANVPFLSMSGSDFVEMFVGVGASRVRDLFQQAKEKAPCIVFIDEIDAIGRARGKNAGFSGNDERENTLNQLLTEMDGFATNAGVIVLAATNRVDILDKALTRAGRFDRQIEVGLPDVVERRQIFDVHLKNIKTDKDLDREFLAKQTPGFSGADIANVCNEAALIAARHDKQVVSKEDFLAAVDRIIGGLEKRNKIITDEEKRKIAYHEAGHATVSWLLEGANPLIKVTIIPRGKALGAAWYLPEERQLTTRAQMMDEMASLLGGRASEALNFGEVSTGALNDLERATKMAYSMVAYYGMGNTTGNISFYDSTGQSDFAMTKPYSEETAVKIDAEAKAMLEEAYNTATQILRDNQEGLTRLAERLLEKEVVFTDDLVDIFGKRKKDIAKELEEAAKNNDPIEESGSIEPDANAETKEA